MPGALQPKGQLFGSPPEAPASSPSPTSTYQNLYFCWSSAGMCKLLQKLMVCVKVIIFMLCNFIFCKYLPRGILFYYCKVIVVLFYLIFMFILNCWNIIKFFTKIFMSIYMCYELLYNINSELYRNFTILFYINLWKLPIKTKK